MLATLTAQPAEAIAPAHLSPLREPALARKFDQFASLDSSERAVLRRALAAKVQMAGRGVALATQGDAPGDVEIILSGWAIRYRVAPTGKRQVLAIYVPGDVCEFGAFLMREHDSHIVAVTDVRTAAIGRAALSELTALQPRLAQGFWWESLSAASIQRQWMVRIAHAPARARVAGLICELAVRLFAVDHADDSGFAMPLTQAELADACGMTSEHTNRTLRELKQAGLVSIERGHLHLQDWDGLSAVAQFRPDYLHFRHLRPELATDGPELVPAVG